MTVRVTYEAQIDGDLRGREGKLPIEHCVRGLEVLGLIWGLRESRAALPLVLGCSVLIGAARLLEVTPHFVCLALPHQFIRTQRLDQFRFAAEDGACVALTPLTRDDAGSPATEDADGDVLGDVGLLGCPPDTFP